MYPYTLKKFTFMFTMMTISLAFFVAALALLPRALEKLPTAPPSPMPTEQPESASTQPEPAGSLSQVFTIILIIAGALIVILLTYLLARRIITDIKARRKAHTLATTIRTRQQRQWDHYRDRHHQLSKLVVATETDWDTIFTKPALTDTTIPIIAHAWQAYADLEPLDTSLPPDLDADQDITHLPYPQAVTTAWNAWQKADRYAARIGQKTLPTTERKTLREIKGLLKIAESPAASDPERRTCYHRIETLTKRLQHVTVPHKMITQIQAATPAPALTTTPARMEPDWQPQSTQEGTLK